MGVVDRSFDTPLPQEELASAPLAGGIMGQGYQCGLLWGAALAAGAQAYQRYGPGPQAESEALLASQRLVEAFRNRYNHIDCGDVIKFNWKNSSDSDFRNQVLKFFLRGGPVGCFRMAAAFTHQTQDELDARARLPQIEQRQGPLSCTALLSHKLGLSPQQVVMASGLAGGIGLSGSACGALGLLVWVSGMQQGAGAEWMPGAENPHFQALTERFLEASGYEFECQKIVGRRFASAADHADYLQGGGCAALLEALAAA
jgi:hypothetical protein